MRDCRGGVTSAVARAIASTLLLSLPGQWDASSWGIKILSREPHRIGRDASLIPALRFMLCCDSPVELPITLRFTWGAVDVKLASRFAEQSRAAWPERGVTNFFVFLFFFFRLFFHTDSVSIFVLCEYFLSFCTSWVGMELNSLLILLEAAEYLERRDRGIYSLHSGITQRSTLTLYSPHQPPLFIHLTWLTRLDRTPCLWGYSHKLLMNSSVSFYKLIWAAEGDEGVFILELIIKWSKLHTKSHTSGPNSRPPLLGIPRPSCWIGMRHYNLLTVLNPSALCSE